MPPRPCQRAIAITLDTYSHVMSDMQREAVFAPTLNAIRASGRSAESDHARGCSTIWMFHLAVVPEGQFDAPVLLAEGLHRGLQVVAVRAGDSHGVALYLRLHSL